MTGDEDVHDLLLDGLLNEFTAICSAGNYAAVTGNGHLSKTPQFKLVVAGAGHQQPPGPSGSFGGRLGSAAHYWRLLVETGDTADANFVNVMIRDLLTVMYQKPCATTGTGSLNQNWPSGCTPVYDGYTNGLQSRGFLAYRGLFLGPNEVNNDVRCVPAPGQNVVSGGYVRCVEPFMQGYLVDAIWAMIQLKGPKWSDYQKLLDLAYGEAINTDASNYLTGALA
ncbi:MAG TPA: hypothetical protein VL177_20230 [Terriglobales bacterium]|nr:hypothetical protein [Terriglobales bacterium]